jgi:vanillate O-demethylase ferredoxin subunit
MKHVHIWQSAVLASLADVTPTVREFLLRPADGHVPRWDGGAHLQVHVTVGGVQQIRHYSLVGQPDGEHYRIAVKRMDGGRGGSKAMWALALNDSISISGPHNHFSLELGASSYLLVAGGIGITPLVTMAQMLIAKKADVRMLYGARTHEELAFLAPLQKLLGNRLRTFVAEENQYMDFAAEIAALPLGAQLYTCGPVPMLEAIRAAWKTAGRRLAHLRFETFGSSGSFPAEAFRVVMPRHGLDFMVPVEQTLLEALSDKGVQTIFDCKRGECGLCAMDVLEIDGELDHRDVFLSPIEKAACNRLCPCVSRVVGTLTLDSAWRPETTFSSPTTGTVDRK